MFFTLKLWRDIKGIFQILPCPRESVADPGFPDGGKPIRGVITYYQGSHLHWKNWKTWKIE